jgi:lysophospholipase L1-like esterase
MPSSTSSSSSPATFHIKVLLGLCAALLLAFELLSSHLLKHDSATYSRVSQQYTQALKIRPAGPGQPTPILLVGNSLLLEGIDVHRLQDSINGQVRVYPVFLEATGYYDWLYGLRRLFRQGARPPIVVLGVGVNGFVADSVRQEYAPLMLFDLQDVLGIASDLKMDRTATSNFLLAHSSVFWDTRAVLRTQILRHTIPRYRELILLLKPEPVTLNRPVFEAVADARLEQLRALCASYGARFILLVPPTPGSAEAVRRMTLAAQKARVETIVPIDPEVLSVKYYQPDELHLNSQGAALFTSALAAFLPQAVYQKGVTSAN